MTENKKYYIQTYGCQMNIADSEHVAGILEGLGFEKAPSLLEADLLIVNTCSVRQAAEDKVYGLKPKIQNLKQQVPNAKVVVMGCMVGSVKGERIRYDEKELLRQLSWADYLYATKDIGQLPHNLVQDGFIDKETWAAQRMQAIEPSREKGTHAYINISTGCDNFCTFCVVPYARGEENSRTLDSLVAEVTHLVERGYSEITLVGQNVNSWGIESRKHKLSIRTNSDEKLPFAHLLRTLHEIEGLKKINFISSNPFDFTIDLVRALALPKISRYLHLAVQSGDDEILRRMNRRHTHEDFVELIHNIRKEVPDIEIGTDFIVGFPGETEEQFQRSVELCEKIKFNVAYVSKYSPRVGTNAQKLYEDNVPREVKRQRQAELNAIVKEYKPKRVL